ncbi:MAG: hypothetical protein R3B72_46240 [Polyangiaceae bacterium]
MRLQVVALVVVVVLAVAGCGSSTSLGQGGGGTGEICGPDVCEAGERCFDVCGTAPVCSLGSITCGEFDFGACGCNGVAYESLCALDAAAVAQGQPGSCTPPAGHFACEALLCRIADHICLTGDSPFCFDKSATCAACDCIDVADHCQGNPGSCEDLPGGGIAITCG